MSGLFRTTLVVAVAVGLFAATGEAAGQGTEAPRKFVPPVRGTAELGYLKPVTKREGDMVVTTIKVKNLSLGSIAGLKIAEFWWDKGGNPVTGSDDRLRKPLLPGDVATLTLRTPFNAKMDRNNYVFSHANGEIKTKLLSKLE